MSGIDILNCIIYGALGIAAAASLYPQIHRIIIRHDSGGISLLYLLLLAVSATYQVTLYTLHLLFHVHLRPRRGGTPQAISAGEWLDFALLFAVFIGTSTLLLIAVSRPPSRFFEKSVVVTLYFTCAAFSFAPLTESISKEPRQPRGGNDHWILSTNDFYITLTVLFGVFPVSLYCQWLLMHQRPVPRALSTRSLGWQAVAFGLVGVSWSWRSLDTALRGWSGWYYRGGYLLLLNLMLAIVQGVLWLYTTWRLQLGLSEDGDVEEATPLLQRPGF